MSTASDDFNRADGAIGSNWTLVSGTWAVASNAANQTDAGGDYYTAIYTATTPASDDYTVAADVRGDNASYGVGVMARGSTSAATGYVLVGFAGDQFYIVRLNAGVETVLTAGGFSACALNTTYAVELEVNGTTIRARIDGGSWTSVTDSNIASGGWGIACHGSVTGGGRWIDTFSAADLAPATIESAAQLWRAPFSAPVYVSGSSDLFDSDAGEAGEIARAEIFDEADAAPADITGAASGTIGALSGSGTGAVYITGAGSGTVGALTGSGAGGVPVAGSASGTIGALSGAGVGGPVVSGAASGTIGELSGQGAGGPVVAGASSGTVGALSGQGSGAAVVAGATTGTVGALSGNGAGTVVGVISGVGSGAVGALSGGGVGSLTIAGAATGSIGALTGAGSGGLLVTGQATPTTIGALSGTALGAVTVSGSAVGTIGALSGYGVAVVVVSGSASGSVGALTGTATGAVGNPPATGIGSGTIGQLTGPATGAVLIEAEATVTIGAITGTGQGAVIVAGQALGTIGALSGSGQGAVVVSGYAAGTIGALTGAGSGVLVINGQAVGVIGDLLGSGAGTATSFSGPGERRVDRLYTDADRRMVAPSRGTGYAGPRSTDTPARPTARAARQKDMIDA